MIIINLKNILLVLLKNILMKKLKEKIVKNLLSFLKDQNSING